MFLAIYLCPTIVVLLSWQLLRKLVRIKAEHRVTSLADLISLRYGRSQVTTSAHETLTEFYAARYHPPGFSFGTR